MRRAAVFVGLVGATGVAAAAVAALRPPPTATQGPPVAADVQSAYDAAAAASGATHVAGLKILGVKCDKAARARFSCEVGFSTPTGDEGRVYLDAALVEPENGGWKLLSGLCKRYN